MTLQEEPALCRRAPCGVCKGTKASSNHKGAGGAMRSAGDQPCPRPSLHLLAGTWLVLRTQPGSPTLQLSSTGCGVHLRGDWGHAGG